MKYLQDSLSLWPPQRICIFSFFSSRDLPNDDGSDKILKIEHETNDGSVLVFTAAGHIYR
jgi:hypothetical protein